MRSMMAGPILATLLLGGCATGSGGAYLGGAWRAVDINGIAVAEGSAVTLLMGGDGRATGSAGCNSYAGTYSTSSRQGLRFGPIVATRKACAEPLMEQERRYLAILGQVVGHGRYGDGSLSLIAGDGSAIRYRR